MESIEVTEAAQVGVAKLVASLESGKSVSFSRDGHVVAEIVSSEEMNQLRKNREDLKDALRVLSRLVADTGARTDLDHAIESFGWNRVELEAEVITGKPTE